ncbi:hypothetical protein GCM10027321_42230 [Massilia terrae]|uniref:Energy transducer TonB n=1 Tax=Massilia terrae TaxID=1811224 RepID=A0ABT2D488_9BURK|nr:hypothetical protein [Massilia terrae]MCS0661065.1 hypothetical protein [Massilia terrae]
MNTIRTSAASLLCMACLCGCSTISSGISSTASLITRPFHHNPSPAAAPAPLPAPVPESLSLDSYKKQVAYQVMQSNPGQTFSGPLPSMLPAIVVLNITVDRDGHIRDVTVQRSRDTNASGVAVDSMRRSEPLPRPANLILSGDALTFSETFLFDERYRFQLRSVAGPQ